MEGSVVDSTVVYVGAIASLLSSIVIVGGSVWIAVYNIRKSSDDRVFQLTKEITLRSLDILVESVYRLESQALNFARAKSRGSFSDAELEETREAKEYIQRYRMFLPTEVSEEIYTASCHLETLLDRSRGTKGIDQFETEVFTRALATVQKSVAQSRELLAKYNLLNQKKAS